MRLFFTLIIAIATLNTACAQLTNGLVGHWNFNGNANDITGNGLNGMAKNITYTAGKNGIANTAAQFNGKNSVVEVPFDTKMNVSQMSICAVIKFNGFYKDLCQHSVILQKGSYFTPRSYSLSIFDNPYDQSCFVYDSTKMVFHHKTHTVENSVHGDSLKHSPNVDTGKWYCVISTNDGTRTRIYINGVQVITYASTAAYGSSSEGLCFGANTFNSSSSHPYWLNGQIDDLRLYDRALSPSEVAQFCNSFDTLLAIKDTTTRTICQDDTFHLAYTVTESFRSGNTFTAELSDVNGSFAAPDTIGTITDSVSGKIICYVPPSITPGNNYKVRVLGNNPVRTSINTLNVHAYNKQPATITIAANPAGPIQPNQPVTYVATTGNAGPHPVIIWFRNGLQIPGINNDSLVLNTLNEDDSIYAVVKSDNPCMKNAETKSNVIHVEIGMSVNMIYLGNLHVYPNPNSGSFNVAATSVLHQEVKIEVFNATGQRVYAQQTKPVNNTLNERISIPDVANGVYLLRISADGKDRNVRLMINR